MKTSGYNIMRDDSALLEEHEKDPPSFCVQLYPDHWTLNSDPKFSYNNPISSLLDDIRALRIPTDFIPIFDDANMPYYNGCLIVEILDFRPARVKEPILERPDRQRVVLRPTAETLWADICILNAKSGRKWTDMDALQIESKLLLATSTPLCLDPDPSLSRIVNSILRVSTPSVPKSLKRKAAAMVDLEEDETEKAKRAKIMQFMNPQFSPSRKPFVRNYKILNVLEQRAGRQQGHQAGSSTMAPAVQPSGTLAPQNINTQQAPEKAPVTVVPQLTTVYSQSNGAPHQPVPMPIPQSQAPPQLQHAVDPSLRASPSKQQQTSNAAALHRPPSRPPTRPPTAAQINVTTQQPQPQAQEQQATQPIAFNPPLPPSNFLAQPPASRRRPSVTINPATPAAPNHSLPTHQPGTQPQVQPQPQMPTQTQTQTQIQTQQQAAPTSRPASQPQRVPPLAQAQHARPTQIPPNIASLQAMRNVQNLQNLQNMQFYQTAGGVPMGQAAATAAAMQRQTLNGRNTPISRANSTASPAPPSTGMTHSPMIPAAAVAAMMSRQNTPVTTNPQVARASPLAAGNHAVAARTVAAQSASQQQPQPAIPGTQPVMMQPGITANQALAYQHYQFQNLQNQPPQHIQAFLARQAQLRQQGQMVAAAQQQQQQHHQQHQQQQAQQVGNAQAQQATTQDQGSGAQAPFVGVVPNPQGFNYMSMGMNPQYVWPQPQGAAGRGTVRVGPNAQSMPMMPRGISLEQMQALGRGGGPPNR